MDSKALGIDVGGSGIKSAIVDLNSGELLSERIRTKTPKSAKPEPVRDEIWNHINLQEWNGPVGIGFPAAIVNDQVMTASNIHKSWLGIDIIKLMSKQDNQFIAINDADAAAYAEMRFGAGNNKKGTVILVTIGTGIGTALFRDGLLIPNTELGHIYLKNGLISEDYMSDRIRKEEALKAKKWAKRISVYLKEMEKLFWPELFIIGGGASKKFDNLQNQFDIQTPIVPAQLLNNAGIIGAALAAGE